MRLNDAQRLELAKLAQDMFNTIAAIGKEARQLRGLDTIIFNMPAYTRNPLIFNGLNSSMSVAEFLWKAGKAFENLTPSLYLDNFEPLKMCRFLQYLHNDSMDNWSHLSREAARIAGYELPPYQGTPFPTISAIE